MFLGRKRTSIGTGGHVGHSRSDVTLGPEGPLKGYVRSSGSFGLQFCGRGTDDTAVGVAAALDIKQSDIGDGAVALDRTGYTLGLRRGSIFTLAIG